MTDDLPDIFQRLTPRPAPAELRTKVLDAVALDLTRAVPRSAPRWERIFELAVAASLLCALGLNAWRWQAERELHARLYGPRPVPMAVANVSEAVESVTDADTARRLRERLIAARPHAASAAATLTGKYRRLIDELTRDPNGARL